MTDLREAELLIFFRIALAWKVQSNFAVSEDHSAIFFALSGIRG